MLSAKVQNHWITILLALVLIYLIYLFIHQKMGGMENFANQPINLSRNTKSTDSQVSKYYKCAEKPISPILEEIFQKYGITKSDSGSGKPLRYSGVGAGGKGNWDLYIPCGYNYVENELPEVTLSESEKPLFIFGISGCDKMVSKNNIWATLKRYYGLEGASDVMPISYVLDDPNDMALFQNDYRDDQIYILKKNVQRKEGLKLTKNYKEITEAVTDDYKVVQKYIRDLYLVNGYKVNLRIYLLAVVRGDEKQFYISDIGKCIYTKKPYSDNDFDFESNITSYHLDMNVYKKNPRTFEDLMEYINKREENPNAGSLFFVRVRSVIQKMCMALANEFHQSENIRKRSDATSFQLFGVDVIMDKGLTPYLLEVNKGPDMSARDEIDHKMKLRIQTEMLEKVGVIQDDFVHTTNSFK
jgi:Tubulin-tyrosine ligase family